MFFRHRSVLPFLLCLFTVASCGKNSGGGESHPEVKNRDPFETNTHTTEREIPRLQSFSVERKTQLNESLENVEEFKKDINTYLVRFRMSSRMPLNSQLVCNRLIFNQRVNKVEAALDSLGEGVIVTRILKSDPSEVEYECFVTSEEKVLVKKNFTIRKSFIISGEKNISTSGLSHKDKIGTLFVDQHSKLFIENKEVHLEMDELISLGGVITTFREEDAINKYENSIGLSGGKLTIKTNYATGQINFILRGMDGGKRTTFPADKTSSLPADSSLNGRCKRPKRGINPQDKNCWGKKGHTGEPGHKGYEGFPGGDSGELKLTIKEHSDLKLNVEMLPGKGSPGGKGGKGGLGSPGGQGVTHRWTTYGGCSREGPCNATDHSHKYPNGAKGDRGPDGPQGDKGKDGKIFSAEVSVGEENYVVENSWNF